MPNGLTKRILGGLALAALIGLVAADPPAALGQKKKKPDADTKPTDKATYAPEARKAPEVKPTIAEGKKLTAEQLAAHIDTLINKRLKDEKVTASSRSTDEEFLRRAYLDITGKIPTAEQAVKFLDSKEANKRPG